MTAQPPFLLFSRQDCHLCEVAAALLSRLGVPFREVDIDEDSGLQERYGLSVPVLRHGTSGRELEFPFGEEQVVCFLDESE